jgi:hypothetical protein
MATTNRVFVSPGVYTSEVDLTFVAQSVGVTTLGLVGETLKGPAFEPILISSFDEFTTYFGSTSPEKDGVGNPKYELGYVAKSYLQESNQLFVTRVLGLTGYKPYNSFTITALGGVTVNTTTTPSSSSGTVILSAVTSSTFYGELSGKTDTNGNSIPTFITGLTPSQGDYFYIGVIPSFGTTGLTGSQITSPIGEYTNKNWFNVYYNQTGANDSTIDGVYSYKFVYNTGITGYNVTRYKYTASLNTDYANIVVASLRPRGHYDSENLILEVSALNSVKLSSTTLGSDPLSEFTLNITGSTGGAKSYTCSLDLFNTHYISKVLGVEVYDKSYSDFPLFVHEAYPNLLKNLFEQGLVRGVSTTIGRHLDTDEFNTQWNTAASPWLVSEVRGGKVADLFRVVTISDGDASNRQVKITIMNINLDRGEFDLLVRDFNDTDDNMVVLEKYSRCSMDSTLPGYIAKKIGTSNGEFPLASKYIMIDMDENAPSDAVPAGFKGFESNGNFGTGTLGSSFYKTSYFDAGETIYYDSLGKPIQSSGDKFRKVSLGFSTQTGFKYDNDLVDFKGTGASTTTYGFHLSMNASSIVDISGNSIYQTTTYDLEGQPVGDKLTDINYRKFTLACSGGFDGWDIYRDVRTFGDQYVYGLKHYVSGNTTNGGVFNVDAGNSDYYAFLQGINTFQNPEAVDINIFATPGINFYEHGSLTSQAIDMVETDRADSLYIINAPNSTVIDNVEDIINNLDNAGIDSNYSAVYWPWIQIRDTDNATQIYIPPTGEVVRNIALTDNVSYPWFAVAGYSRGLVKSIKASKKLTLDDRDVLYKARINPIATFSDTGTIIWGNKTLQVRESALDRINVRRLLLRARKLISAVSVRLLFDQNDDQVRNEFLRLVNPILESIKKERGLYDFRVTVSNAPEDLDANTLRGKIYIKPTRSLEFIDLEFIVTPTGASFDNI